jgi:Methyltransferase domain
MKIAAKIILSRTSVTRAACSRIGIFKHGQMEEAAYALEVFTRHAKQGKLREGFTALELGPGDSLLSAPIAAAFGAARIYLVDTESYATKEAHVYQAALNTLRDRGLRVPDWTSDEPVGALLARCNAVYLTDGLLSLRAIPEASVDFIWSHAVLEHVRRGEFRDTLIEMHRMLSLKGFASHEVDLKDHLASSLNNLRFSRRLWESQLFSNSGFYTNRLRQSEICEMATSVGFEIEVTAEHHWPALPISRRRLHPIFRDFPDGELAVSEFNIVLRHATSVLNR